MSKVMRKAVTAMAAGAAVIGFGLVAAAPAQATVAECRAYLFAQGYPNTTNHIKACERGASGRPADYSQCYAQLRILGVAQGHAETACRLAAARLA